MRDNTTHSLPADAGKCIEDEMIKSLGDCFDVQEAPLVNNEVRMDLEELSLFCKRQNHELPLFRLKVEETIQGFVRFPVKNPHYKYFTIWNNWMFYSTKSIDTKEPVEMEGGQIIEGVHS